MVYIVYLDDVLIYFKDKLQYKAHVKQVIK